jgi:hypothetical protein
MADDIVLGAKQFPNPNNIKPKWDTEPRSVDEPVGAKMSIENAPADPEKANGLLPKEHPLEEHFRKPSGVRHPLGQGVPKNHPAIKISNN